MKITKFNLRIFLQELQSLEEMIPDVVSTGETWLKYQEEREKYGWQDQYGTQASRMALEERLNEVRQKMALVYDFQSDRGLVNFEPTQMEALVNGGTELGGSPEGDGHPQEEEGTQGVSKLVRLLQERNRTSGSSEEKDNFTWGPQVQDQVLPEEESGVH